MNYTLKKKILLFGAGRMNRSLIAKLFYSAGYDICFIDSDKTRIDLLKEKNSYKIIVKGHTDQITEIKEFKAFHTHETDAIENEIMGADLATISIGESNLKKASDLIANGLKKRVECKYHTPLDIIVTGSLKDTPRKIRTHLKSSLPPDFPLSNYLGLVESSIGTMLPQMTREELEEDPLRIYAESFNTLILDKNGFLNPVPDIEGLVPKENIKAWADRKFFIQDLGHTALAYLAYIKNPKSRFTWQAMEDNEIHNAVSRAMQEAAHILMHMHPEEHSRSGLTDHINDLLIRFANPALKNTLFSVGCNIGKQLGTTSPLVKIITYAAKNKLPCKNIMKVLISGIYFDAKDENNEMPKSDRDFLTKYNRDLSRILTKHCKFDPDKDSDLIFLGMNMNERIKENLIK